MGCRGDIWGLLGFDTVALFKTKLASFGKNKVTFKMSVVLFEDQPHFFLIKGALFEDQAHFLRLR